MRILLLPLGSLGDVNPFIGLGLALQKRGHEVVVVTNGYFERIVKQAGLAFVSSSSPQAYLDAIHNPRAWHRKKGPALLARHLLTALPEMFSRIKQLHQPGKTVMAALPHVFAAKIAQESFHIPLATLILSPVALRSTYDVVGLQSRCVGSRLRRWTRRMRFSWHDLKSSTVFAPEINSFRENLGLEPLRLRGLWSSSPQRVIGLWPEWFYGPQPDWPQQAVVTGFIEYDGAPTEGSLGPWDSVIDSDSSGRRPIVFTPGTACFDTSDFFAAACEACEILNWPGILLTQQEQPVRKPLPRIVRHIRYAPLGELLPLTAGIVHHGGIGTSARALKAGIPQLVMPMAYDQHDNAHRLVRLGVAKSIERRDFTAQQVAVYLSDLLQSQTILERCQHYARRFECSNALQNTCDYIEALSENCR